MPQLEDRKPASKEDSDLYASPEWPREAANEGDEAEAESRAQAKKIERLQAFGHTMSLLRDDWVRARQSNGVDRRWRDDGDQYNGQDAATRQYASMMEQIEAGGQVAAGNRAAWQQLQTRSTVFVGLTRSKTNAGEADLSDILLPVDDKNWGIQPTPNAQLSHQLEDSTPVQGPDGSPVVGPKMGLDGRPEFNEDGTPQAVPYKMRDVAIAVQKMAADAADGMEREINDQLVECDYLAEVRKMLHDAAVYGTGVLMGPIVTARTRKAWVPVGLDERGKQVYALKVVIDRTPASFRVDPRFVWPDPACGEDVQHGRGVIHMEEMTAKRVKDLAQQPGYIASQLAQVLREGPKAASTYIDPRLGVRRDQQEIDKLFQVWTYTGEVELEDLIAAGVKGLPEKMTEDERTLMSASGVVVVINSTVVRAALNPLETGDLPFDFFQWESVADTVFGYGVPYLLRAQQRILNSAWRQMMDNSAMTVLPQIVMKRGAVVPADQDGNMSIYSGKMWYAKDDVQDVEKAFMTFDFPNHQERLEKIIAKAEDLSDKETGLPMLAQGERGSSPDTVGGMQMLMNAKNVVRRRQVKNFDDFVTKRHIRRYYDYNMAYSDNDEIKGDFAIDARGSSALLIRDIQNQAFMTIAQTAQTPMFMPLVDARKLMVKMLQAQHIKPDDVLKSEDQVKREEEAAAKVPPPADPRIEAAKIMAQSATERVQAQTQVETAKQQSADQLAALKLQSEQQRLEAEFGQRADEFEKQLNLKIMELSENRNLSLDSIKAALAGTTLTLKSKERMFDKEAGLRLTTGEGI